VGRGLGAHLGVPRPPPLAGLGPPRRLAAKGGKGRGGAAPLHRPYAHTRGPALLPALCTPRSPTCRSATGGGCSLHIPTKPGAALGLGRARPRRRPYAIPPDARPHDGHTPACAAVLRLCVSGPVPEVDVMAKRPQGLLNVGTLSARMAVLRSCALVI
jgi:hypothetical protein